jgi:hypothetical protein
MVSHAKVSRKTGARSQLLELSVRSLQLVNFQIYDSIGHFRSATVTPARYVICNYPHESLYGTSGRKEGYIVADEDRYVLEAKYQDSSGSVDEKLPYLWMSFLASPVPGWIAVLDGNYWTRNARALEARAWLARQSVPEGREFHLFNRTGFMTWVRGKWGFDATDGQQHRRAQHQAERTARADRQADEQLLWGD